MPSNATDSEKITWALDAISTIERASGQSDPSVIADNFVSTGPLVETRTLNIAAPTLANVVAVLATLINDLAKGGANRTQ